MLGGGRERKAETVERCAVPWRHQGSSEQWVSLLSRGTFVAAMYAHGIALWAYAHGVGSVRTRSRSHFQEQMTAIHDPETASGSWIFIKQHRKSEKCSNIDEYGASRAENSSKSISNFLSIGTPPRPPDPTKCIQIGPNGRVTRQLRFSAQPQILPSSCHKTST